MPCFFVGIKVNIIYFKDVILLGSTFKMWFALCERKSITVIFIMHAPHNMHDVLLFSRKKISLLKTAQKMQYYNNTFYILDRMDKNSLDHNIIKIFSAIRLMRATSNKRTLNHNHTTWLWLKMPCLRFSPFYLLYMARRWVTMIYIQSVELCFEVFKKN